MRLFSAKSKTGEFLSQSVFRAKLCAWETSIDSSIQAQEVAKLCAGSGEVMVIPTGRQLSAPPTPEAEQEPPRTLRVPRPLHPVEQLARSRRPPLIEYCASGSYVIISSHEGEVHLEPNSRAWFDWLATLSSFRFVGPTGRFTAHRGYKRGQQTLYWSASRCVRRHTYKHYLGMTESLTLASLEHTAARLQSDVDIR